MVTSALALTSNFKTMKVFFFLFVALFCIMGCEKDPDVPSPTVPNVTSTTNASSITSTTARSGGHISSSGGLVLLNRGVCWSTSINPTVNNNKVEVIGGLGSFTCDIIGLAPGTQYYLRAYATNALASSYGNQVIFTTLNTPTVSTSAVTNITTTSAVCGGSVTSGGGTTVSARGVCWSTSMNPTVALSTKTVNGSGTGTFSSSITGLTSRRLYYVRAYATNSLGTSYGQNVSFTTN